MSLPTSLPFIDVENARVIVDLVAPPGATGVSAQAMAPTLSAQLRARTAPLHAQAEALLGLPDAIRTKADYRAWLGRFLGLYEPLERSLATFHDWQGLGIDLANLSRSDRLAGDLVSLGIDPRAPPRAPSALLPDLPAFAHAMGAVYVLEGSALGGRVILRDINARIGPQIAGAAEFLGGRGEALGPMWLSFKAALDRYGCEQPQCQAHVIAGAEEMYRAILAWFVPFCSKIEVAA